MAEWRRILGKPTLFPPERHTHPVSEVDGLDHRLAGLRRAIVLDLDNDSSGAQALTIGDVQGLPMVLSLKASQAEMQGKADVADVLALGSPAPNASYRTLLDCTGSHTAARVAGTYGMAQGQPLAITGVGTLYALNTVFVAAADYPTVNGLAAKLRVRAQLYTNDVAPTGNYTVGLHPVTRPATSGAAGLCIYTIGAAIAGSTCVFTAPAADGLHTQVGADFALPANGHYIIGVVTTAAVAASAHIHVAAQLQMRNS